MEKKGIYDGWAVTRPSGSPGRAAARTPGDNQGVCFARGHLWQPRQQNQTEHQQVAHRRWHLWRGHLSARLVARMKRVARNPGQPINPAQPIPDFATSSMEKKGIYAVETVPQRSGSP